MEATLIFSTLMKECVKPFLNDKGYSGRGNTYLINMNRNWLVVNFQKSGKSSSKEVLFTINLGVASVILFTFFSNAIKRPKIEDCHWRQRIGFLLPQHSDVWWTIDSKTKHDKLCNEIIGCLNTYALPAIESFSDDYKLRDLWLSGEAPGLTEIQRLMNLYVLVKKIGPRDILNEIAEEMCLLAENKPVFSTVDALIKKLR